MALRDKLRDNTQPFLQPGERIEVVFNAQTGPNPYLSILTYLVLFWVKVHVIAVTDQRILVLKGSFWRPSSIQGVEQALPRATQLGPVSGLWSQIQLGGVGYWVHRRFHKDVNAADAALGGGGGPQPAQLPPAGWGAPQQQQQQGGFGPPQQQGGFAPPQQPYAPPAPAPPGPAQPTPQTWAAGWYDDPQGQARWRYWDGTEWTAHTSN